MSDSLIAFTNEEYSVIEPLLNNLAAFSEEYPLLYSEMKKQVLSLTIMMRKSL